MSRKRRYSETAWAIVRFDKFQFEDASDIEVAIAVKEVVFSQEWRMQRFVVSIA